MAGISLSAAWDETNRLIRREATLLVPVALALIVLPSVVLDQFRPDAVALPAADTAFRAAMLANPASLLITLYASLVLTLLALRPGISVAEALRGALRRFGVAAGASLLLGVAFALLIAPALPVIVGGERAVRTMNPAFALLLSLYLIAVSVALVYVLVRLLLLNTVAAAERLGVFATVARSWELTRGLFVRLIGFIAMFVLVSAVAGIAVVTGGGTVLLGLGRLLGDEGIGRLLLDIVRDLANAVFVTWLYLMLAAIYRQVAAGSKSAI